ncbi:MAG TPA: xanthine dehydrogenase family protein subunit M [Egicoccus sp.]|nr:xanthine dehydrogenase family protein subunit M [Egicoccus sp.]HSK23076.1 xanthine dehydrogenase family protein subunit M [Egicoccus sp.]
MQVPETFTYERAGSIEEAIGLLERHGDEARLIAGGHSLLPMMKLRLAAPETLIDITGVPGLDQIRVEGDHLVIGALVRHVDLLESALLAEHYRVFGDAERVIADPLVRNRGTIGGSLCQADPAEDLSAVCSALRAEVVIHSSAGPRTVPVREFHDGPYMTAVGDAEMLTEIRIPIRPGAGSAYEKVERRAGDWAVAAAGAFVQLDGDTISDVGIGLSAVGAAHFTCTEAEDALRGRPPTADVLAEAAQLCHDHCSPTADQRGPEDYKRHLARELTLRALTRAVAHAQGEVA